ncbi:hypothetical protein J5N97_017840 [Dioscorea zingiberensis]|uniref:Uncharacterized protein n=1 Tax=Dioscorea zingiberensis TaxID=325984 RepID=A0A9D5CMB9_9LILI|nr:hypothetical protein J5N97_017840 [Dioscorea zingiberensis]
MAYRLLRSKITANPFSFEAAGLLSRHVTVSGNSQACSPQCCTAFYRQASSEVSLQTEQGGEKGYKGHDMLAPFTAGWQSTDLHPLVIERSEGSYVYDSNGKKYLDALAGLWCTALGGNEPRLVEAATKQLNKLPFYHSFWNRTTRPSLDLAKEILEIFTARKMGKVFFTNSGSEANDSQIAAFIAEPVMGAGGVILPPKTYFEKVQAVIKKYDILFIADEVITAFGRLGTMFGCDKYHIQPDLVSIAKALSSAYMPIGAILVSPEISEVIHSQSSKLGSFSHGFTYSGHPVACAVALEALKIYKERNIVEKVQAISPRFQNGIKSFSESPIIGEIRGTGLVLGTEFTDNKSPNQPFPSEWGVGAIFGAECEKRGMLVRVAGDSMMMAPPFIISPEEVDELISIYGESLRSTERIIEELKSQNK